MKNIIIFGLQYESNLGDQVIGNCTRYLVDKALCELDIRDHVEIREVDMLGRITFQTPPSQIHKNSKFKNVVKTLLPPPIVKAVNARRNAISDKRNVPLTIFRTKHIVENAIDNNTSAIIIAGGGLIKYKAQEFYLLIDVITECAQKHSIPVMLNAVGVEGYDTSSLPCQQLKKALNRPCVKVVTTRDNIALLDDKYIVSDGIRTRRVPDPALWVDEIFKPTAIQNHCIGLSVARSNIFVEHGIEVSGKDLCRLWKEITDELDKMDIRWKYFCNGTFSDFEFLKTLIKESYADRKYEEIVLDRAVDPKMLVDQINSFSTILSVRLHAAIISYAYKIPVVQLVWNEKQILFGKSIGYEDRFITNNNFNAKYIVSKLIEANIIGYNNYEEKKNRISTYSELLSFISKYSV